MTPEQARSPRWPLLYTFAGAALLALAAAPWRTVYDVQITDGTVRYVAIDARSLWEAFGMRMP